MLEDYIAAQSPQRRLQFSGRLLLVRTLLSLIVAVCCSTYAAGQAPPKPPTNVPKVEAQNQKLKRKSAAKQEPTKPKPKVKKPYVTEPVPPPGPPPHVA